MRILTISLLAMTFVCCKPSVPTGTKTKLGPFPAEEWKETTPDGLKLRCYLLGGESNAPVRLCGEGTASPDGQNYLIEALAPAPGPFTQSGQPVEPGWYLLRPVSASKVDAWPLGQLGAHEWLGRGKILLTAETNPQTHVTRIHLLDPVSRTDRAFEVPYSKGGVFRVIRADEDVSVLLLQRTGIELAIMVRAPLSGAYVETLELSSSENPGAKKLWARGAEIREHGAIFSVDSSILSRISWKGEDPLFDELPLGPFDPLEEGKRRAAKKHAATAPATK